MSGLSDDSRLAATLPGEESPAEPEIAPQGLTRGSTIGRYMLVERAGTGAMGVVFAAYDPTLDRKVALKILKPRGRDLRGSRERLQREAQALAKLDHPNVVSVHDVGVHDDQLFVAMEFIEGQTLAEWINSAPSISTASRSSVDADDQSLPGVRPWRDVLELFVQAGRGLAAAHEAGLVHRDFKPDNVMLSEDGRVRVMDFGLARVDDAQEPQDETIDLSDAQSKLGSLTKTGAMMGTPGYMSLEQFGVGPVDARSDQFGYCVALYEALYGARPFTADTVGELVAALHEGVVREPVRDAQVPSWIRAVIVRGLAPDPEGRFESMRALLDALEADPLARRRRIATRVALGLVLVAGLGGVASLSDEVAQRDAVIEEQASELELKNEALEDQLTEQARLLSIQRGLRAKTLIRTGAEADALLLGVQAVGAYADAWTTAPAEAMEGLAHVLAHETDFIEASEVLQGHTDYLTSVAYSPDGRRLATSSLDGSAKIWDVASARPHVSLDDHGSQVYHLAFSPDGTRLATSSEDGHARIWNVASGELLLTLTGHEAQLTNVQFSPDGTQVATAGAEPTVRLWNAQTGVRVATLHASEGSEDMVLDLAYTPDGARLVTAASDASARVWDTNTGTQLATLVGHEGPILAVAISPDGTRAATASVDTDARTWNLDTGELVSVLEGHQLRASNLVYSPDGTRLVTVSWDRTGRVYAAETGTLITVLDGGHGFGVVAVDYSPDGTRVATGSFDGSVAVWNPETGAQKAQLRGHRGDVWTLAFAPDGRQLATASVDHSARLWNIGENQVVVLEGPETGVRTFAYSPDHEELVTLSHDGRLRQWTAETGELVRTLDEELELGFIAYSRDGTQLAATSAGRLKLFDMRTGATPTTISVSDPKQKLPVSFSPSGTLLHLSSVRNVQVFDAHTHERLAVIEHDHDVRSRSFSPDDEHLIVVTASSLVQRWDPRTGVVEEDFGIPGGDVFYASFSPDGTTIVTLSRDTGVQLWDAESLAPRATLPDSTGVESMVFSPDGSRIAGGGTAVGLRSWDVERGEFLMQLEPEITGFRMQRLEYSPDGTRLVAHGSNLMRVYATETGAPLAYINDTRSAIHQFDLWPDSKRLTTMSTDSTLEVWNIETGESLARERIGVVQQDESILWPIPARELTRIGCMRLRLFEPSYAQVRNICAPLVDERSP